jgi:hypothetical protein
MAYVMCQEFVKDQLKAPATADFPYMTNSDVSVVSTGEGRYSVAGYVDAENSFGATLRTRYRCSVYWAGGDTWRLSEPVQLLE